MTGLQLAHSARRRRRKLIYLAIAVCSLFILLTHRYLAITFNILFRGPFIAAYQSDHLRLSERDGFDITFRSYPDRPPVPSNASDVVPAIMHHIMLGSTNDNSTALRTAYEACVAMHPNYQFRLWTDANATDFVTSHFPELYNMWSSYKYTIQKADSLRYMVLYVYGGKFAIGPNKIYS
jgi:inositol phosphorylceramide mannosyltransferase catalytic subunit